jgi:hypothetical protein
MTSKFLAASYKNESNHLLFGGLYRILSSYWLAHFYLMKKSAKGLYYFGLDCGMLEFFTHEPQSKGKLLSFPHFWSRKDLSLCTYKP